MRSVNPATGELVAEYPELSAGQLRQALEECRRAFLSWRALPIADRALPMRELARALRAERDHLAALATLEMGKAIRESRGEVEKCAWACEHYAEHAARYLADEAVANEARSSRVVCLPLGVILAVMPWNFPYWQVFRFVAPALMAGNAVLLKHASNVTGCALEVEGLVRRAGFPEGLLRTLLVPSASIAAIIADPRVVGVTLTGSEPAGIAVAVEAARGIKKSVLELGGSDASLVLPDAELEAAAAACVTGRLINAGQSCIAAKRFIVVKEVLPAFTRLVERKMAAVRVGDPMEESTEMGPLARADLRDELQGQVSRSIAAGARLLLGGRIPEGRGFYYPPTLLEGVRPGMPVFDEEVFGPVASLIAARDEEDAVELANRSRFGLGAAVFTGDRARGERIAEQRLEAGCCFVNTYVRSDPRLPFGGVKASGYGRELGEAGIREWVNVKTVTVA